MPYSGVWGIVSEKRLAVSPKVIQSPYITQKTKGLGESLLEVCFLILQFSSENWYLEFNVQNAVH